MQVVVSGATGTIGRAVVGSLCARGDAVVALTRDERRVRESLPGEVVAMRWAEPTDQPPPRAALAGADAVLTCSASRSTSAGPSTRSAGSADRVC